MQTIAKEETASSTVAQLIDKARSMESVSAKILLQAQLTLLNIIGRPWHKPEQGVYASAQRDLR